LIAYAGNAAFYILQGIFRREAPPALREYFAEADFGLSHGTAAAKYVIWQYI